MKHSSVENLRIRTGNERGEMAANFGGIQNDSYEYIFQNENKFLLNYLKSDYMQKDQIETHNLS